MRPAACAVRVCCAMRSVGALALVLVLAQGAQLPSACVRLDRDLQTCLRAKGLPEGVQLSERALRCGGAPVQLAVAGAGASRAWAAVLHVALRVALHYPSRLLQRSVDVCELAARRDYCELAVVSPGALLPQSGCGVASVRLSSLSALRAGTAAPALFAHIPDARCTARAAAWAFYSNVTDAAGCDFLLAGGQGYSIPRSIEVLVRNESDHDAQVVRELEKRIATFPLRLRIFDDDRSLRRRIFELLNTKAFLFVDEDIWADHPRVVRVQPPPCTGRACPPGLLPERSVRLGDGTFMERYAPAVARHVARFTLNPGVARFVLEAETRTANITEAACEWALSDVAEYCDSVYPKNHASAPTYTVALYACDGDPDLDAYRATASFVAKQLFNATAVYFEYPVLALDCTDEHQLADRVWEKARDIALAGVVAWGTGAGAPAAAAAAQRTGLPLMLVGAAPAPLSPVVRAPSGRAADVVRSLRRLLRLCGWSRVAVLSDASAYSSSFEEALLAGAEFVPLAVKVNSPDVVAALTEVREADARVVVVNASWNTSAAVVCGALRLGMDAERAWLVREWRAPGCGGLQRLQLYSLGVSARGPLRGAWAGLERHAGRAADAASLADALILLTVAFDSFLRNFSAFRYDLRGSASYFSKVFDEINATGVATALKSEDYARKDPTVYIGRWNGTSMVTTAEWAVTRGDVRQRRPAGDMHCAAALGAAPVPVEAACLTVRSGAGFHRRCHDTAVYAGGALLAVAICALAAARRVRVRRLAAHDLALREAIHLRRRRAVSALDAYLVDRAAIKLLHEIGSGCYGRVHFAELRRPDGELLLVAAKEPREGAAPAEEGEFLREACVLMPLVHAHVVRLVGVCVASGPPIVLMEHALHLDLQRYLTERRGARSEPGSTALTRLAREAAAALEYLASRRLVHRDVRAANCLVDHERSLKLADFGMARELDAQEPEYATTRRGMFPVLWMAPESLESGVFSPATDVWALGVLILEVATLGERPFGKWAPARVVRYVTAGGHPPLPPDLARDTRSVVLQCWRRRAELRPSAACVCSWLAQRKRAVRAARLPPVAPLAPALLALT